MPQRFTIEVYLPNVEEDEGDTALTQGAEEVYDLAVLEDDDASVVLKRTAPTQEVLTDWGAQS